MKPSFASMAAAFVLICSCTGHGHRGEYQMPIFEENTNVSVNLISDELMCNLVLDIFESGDCLFVIHFDRETQSWCQVYDKNTGKKLNSLIHYGNGPKEMIAGPVTCSIGDSLFFFDQFSHKVLSASMTDLSETGSDAIQEDSRNLESYARNVGFTNHGDNILVLNQIGYLNTDREGYHRIVYQDLLENNIAVQDYEPFEEQVQMFHMYNQSIMAISPTENNVVLGSVWGAVLEIYSLPSLERKNVLKLVEPALKFDKNIELTAETKAGLRDIYATDDCFYASIGADVNIIPNSNKSPEEQELVCNDIYVFDWTGKPIKHIEANYNIEKFCLNEAEDTIFAVVSDRGKKLFLGTIDL